MVLKELRTLGLNKIILYLSITENLRIKQEPTIVIDRDSSDKLIEKSSGEVYLGGRGFDTSNYGLVNDHKLNITPFKQSKKLKCPFCDRLYGYETNLRAHVRQRHQGIRVSCPFCSRTFTRNNTVRRHIAREHKNEISIKAFQTASHQVTDSLPQ
ncbi:hypothetical protein G9C98_003641 [Cotesia typhae]|uniref:C2H2-type domain-containing protein n=1 Tax=Cotesia typhae TaxID=2053667 RepID=A0A8J5V863_9HYME|nr:hypothetical protein G9C98_003641 [Cotesia typhae]